MNLLKFGFATSSAYFSDVLLFLFDFSSGTERHPNSKLTIGGESASLIILPGQTLFGCY